MSAGESRPLQTHFAPPDRASVDVVRGQSERLAEDEMLRQLYEAVSEIVLILNANRQIVFCNTNLLALLGLDDPRAVYGRRPGEVLGCQHACTAPEGCGTSEFCRTCGAVNAILVGQDGRPDVRECRIVRDEGHEALDLLVRTTPLRVDGESFTIVSIADISHEKRRWALERIFFHDLLNMAAGIKMTADLLADADAPQATTFRRRLKTAASRLIDEIRGQRNLAAAESDELLVQPTPIETRGLLDDLLEVYAESQPARGVTVILDESVASVRIVSDQSLLGRVIGNMIRNAVEACRRGHTVTVGCHEADGGVEFTVHNPGLIDADVQRQLFQRSFSTKGAGRGLGTYSMKLLGEKYLAGRISFTSSEESGTMFRAWFPLTLKTSRA